MIYDTIVIGAGQAGLAVGYYLAAKGADFLILEAGIDVGDSWRNRWDSLRLFTPVRYNGLPGMPFPGEPDELPRRDEVVGFLQAYACRFQLPVHLRTRVRQLELIKGQFVIQAGEETLTARSIIIATGAYGKPHVPAFASELNPSIVQVHSSSYRNPAQLNDRDVLVVGAGNSGAQIAIELAQSRRVWLSGRDTGNIPRRFLGRDIYRWLWPTLMRPSKESWIGRPLMSGRLFTGDPLVGITLNDLKLANLTRVGPMTGVQGGFPAVDSGTVLEVGAVVWSTGFRPDFTWIKLPVFGPDGYPIHRRGLITGTPGLAFVGLRFQYRFNSSLLGGVGQDAEFVVSALNDGLRRAD
jgi:putative flavoprotein involved in K+ transport